MKHFCFFVTNSVVFFFRLAAFVFCCLFLQMYYLLTIGSFLLKIGSFLLTIGSSFAYTCVSRFAYTCVCVCVCGVCVCVCVCVKPFFTYNCFFFALAIGAFLFTFEALLLTMGKGV